MRYRQNCHRGGVFRSAAMPGSIAPPDFQGYGYGYRGYRGYGEDAPAAEPAIPAKYVAYGALGIASVALLIVLARGN